MYAKGSITLLNTASMFAAVKSFNEIVMLDPDLTVGVELPSHSLIDNERILYKILWLT